MCRCSLYRWVLFPQISCHKYVLLLPIMHSTFEDVSTVFYLIIELAVIIMTHKLTPKERDGNFNKESKAGTEGVSQAAKTSLIIFFKHI